MWIGHLKITLAICRAIFCTFHHIDAGGTECNL
jgi:hypothetical protein